MIARNNTIARKSLLGLGLSALGCLTLLAAGPAHAGRTLGPADHYDTVDGDSTDTYHMTFDGGDSARIEAEGLTDGDIDVYVYDEDGDLVTKDTLYDNDPICHWYCDDTQQYTVKVVNNSGHAVDYHLTTN